jgi:hypothetical protein
VASLYTSCVLGLRPSALFNDILTYLSKKKKMDQLSRANNQIINPKELIRYIILILQCNIRTIFYNLVGYNQLEVIAMANQETKTNNKVERKTCLACGITSLHLIFTTSIHQNSYIT